MKNIFFFIIILTVNLSFSQDKAPVFTYSKNKDLSIQADQIFQTNKYLNFKNYDILELIVDGEIYEKIDLNNYFDYKKNWQEVEEETFLNYKQNGEKFKYTFQNNTMTESYKKYGSFGVWREIKTTYNSKGFLLNRSERISVEDNYNETRIIINKFDKQNRVVNIKERTEKRNPSENYETSISAIYSDDTITVTSAKGTIICKFSKDANAIGFVSKLSPRATLKYFINCLINNRLDILQDYCTNKLSKEINSILSNYQEIEDIDLIKGKDILSFKQVNMEDVWIIKFKNQETNKYTVKVKLLKQINGWKIDEVNIENFKKSDEG